MGITENFRRGRASETPPEGDSADPGQLGVPRESVDLGGAVESSKNCACCERVRLLLFTLIFFYLTNNNAEVTTGSTVWHHLVSDGGAPLLFA